jgi:hypothetical protein
MRNQPQDKERQKVEGVQPNGQKTGLTDPFGFAPSFDVAYFPNNENDFFGAAFAAAFGAAFFAPAAGFGAAFAAVLGAAFFANAKAKAGFAFGATFGVAGRAGLAAGLEVRAGAGAGALATRPTNWS